MKTSKDDLENIAAVSEALQALRASVVTDYFLNTTLHDAIADRLADIGDESSFESQDESALGRLGDMYAKFKRSVARAKER